MWFYSSFSTELNVYSYTVITDVYDLLPNQRNIRKLEFLELPLLITVIRWKVSNVCLVSLLYMAFINASFRFNLELRLANTSYWLIKKTSQNTLTPSLARGPSHLSYCVECTLNSVQFLALINFLAHRLSIRRSIKSTGMSWQLHNDFASVNHLSRSVNSHSLRPL